MEKYTKDKVFEIACEIEIDARKNWHGHGPLTPYLIEQGILKGMELAGAQVKEGPSVEDIMEVVKGSNAWDTLLESPHRIVEMDYYEMDIRTRLSALFTQTQATNELTEVGNAMAAMLRRFCNDRKELGHLPTGDDLNGAGNLADMWDAAQGIGGAAESRSDEGGRERSGPPQSPVAEERSDAPKNNEEQSEDAALPDGRWIPAKTGLKLDELILEAIHALNRARIHSTDGGVASVNINNAGIALNSAREITLDLYDATTR